MFQLVESKEGIAEAQRKLEATIRREFSIKRTIKIQSCSPVEVVTDGNCWYHPLDFILKTTQKICRLNRFGFLKKETKLPVVVEINVRPEHSRHQAAGFFARKAETDTIYLFHSGQIQGGKSDFLAFSNLSRYKIFDSSGHIREGILVMPVEGMAATRSMIRYVNEVAKFKKALKEGKTESTEFKDKQRLWKLYYSEPRGRRRGERSKEIDYVSRHGEVVDALSSWREKTLPPNEKIVKNVFIDMGVKINNDLVEVFEVKTDTSRTNLYGAIGQLMVHGGIKKCRKTIVLPDTESIPSDINDALQKLDVNLLRFKLDAQKAIILP